LLLLFEFCREANWYLGKDQGRYDNMGEGCRASAEAKIGRSYQHPAKLDFGLD
jgi:hypothetical protein